MGGLQNPVWPESYDAITQMHRGDHGQTEKINIDQLKRPPEGNSPVSPFECVFLASGNIHKAISVVEAALSVVKNPNKLPQTELSGRYFWKHFLGGPKVLLKSNNSPEPRAPNLESQTLVGVNQEFHKACQGYRASSRPAWIA